MIKTARWVERKFEFDLPVEMFPNLLERLRGTPARIEDKIKSLPRALMTRRNGEAWSVQEHIGHLLDLEPLWFGRLDDFDAHFETLRPADMTNRKTHDANHNSARLDDLLSAFRASRQTLVLRLERYRLEDAACVSLHPRLKTPMRVIDLVQFVCEHDDHHLVRMNEVMAQLKH